jgi:sterol desaturase/sphingolipid hydroxylase (fatty acid hydroxylase superfamily)
MIVYIILSSIAFISVVIYCSSFYSEFEQRMKDETYLTTVALNYILSVGIVLVIFNYTKLGFGFPLIKNIIITLLATDTIYYWTHYTSHLVPLIKKYMHSMHHEVVNLLPLDTFFLDILDHVYYVILTLGLPFLFIENLTEYIIVIMISTLHSIYLHSDISDDIVPPVFISSKFHKLHHEVGKGNYSILFPFWDDYMATRIKLNDEKITKTETESKTMTLDQFKEECKKGKKLTIINNEIIDCTSWIDNHPGGKSMIERIIGIDSTDTFMAIHANSKMANAMLKTLKVADLSK